MSPTVWDIAWGIVLGLGIAFVLVTVIGFLLAALLVAGEAVAEWWRWR